MTFDEWWKQIKPAECDEVKPYFEEAWQTAVAKAKDDLLKKRAPKPRELPRCGTGGLHDEQQYCFEKGWKEGIAAFRKAMRSNGEVRGASRRAGEASSAGGATSTVVLGTGD